MPPNNGANAVGSSGSKVNSVNAPYLPNAPSLHDPALRRRALTDVSNNSLNAANSKRITVGVKRAYPKEDELNATFRKPATRRRVDKNLQYTVHVSSNCSLQKIYHQSQFQPHVQLQHQEEQTILKPNRMSVEAILCHPEPILSPILNTTFSTGTAFLSAKLVHPFISTVLDIDSIDKHNHLAEPTLAIAIHNGLLERETKYGSNNLASSTYMDDIQPNITPRMRRIVVDWLVDVHKDFKFTQITLHLAVNIMDRFLSKVTIARSKFQLLGITSLWIASKYQERCTPYLDDFVSITDWSYSRLDMFKMESLVCNTLQFRFTVITALPFLARCVKAFTFKTVAAAAAGVACQHESPPQPAYPSPVQVENLASYIIELSLCEYSILKYRPSLVAAAAVAIASNACSQGYQHIIWDSNMKFHSGGYTLQELNHCAIDLCHTISITQANQKVADTNAVRRKYSTQAFGSVALNNFNFNLNIPQH